MDPLDRFFDGPRAARAFVMAVEMEAPWGMRIEDEASLTLVLVTRGSAVLDGVTIHAGDVALVRGPGPYLVTDAAGSVPSIVIGAGQVCTTADGVDLQESFAHGVRRWGNSLAPDTVLIVGAYEHDGAVGRLVTLSLPRVLVAPRTPAVKAVSSLLRQEVGNTGLGQQAILDRLLDTLVVTALREWLTAYGDTLDSTWLNTTDTVAVGGLRAMHAEPAAPWTVAALADRVHVSRATFAARFHHAVGASPMAYLSRWRLTLAAEHLADESLTVANVAQRVGYDNPFAFSAAFKRHHGVSPSEFRRRASLGTARA